MNSLSKILLVQDQFFHIKQRNTFVNYGINAIRAAKQFIFLRPIIFTLSSWRTGDLHLPTLQLQPAQPLAYVHCSQFVKEVPHDHAER